MNLPTSKVPQCLNRAVQWTVLICRSVLSSPWSNSLSAKCGTLIYFYIHNDDFDSFHVMKENSFKLWFSKAKLNPPPQGHMRLTFIRTLLATKLLLKTRITSEMLGLLVNRCATSLDRWTHAWWVSSIIGLRFRILQLSPGSKSLALFSDSWVLDLFSTFLS